MSTLAPPALAPTARRVRADARARSRVGRLSPARAASDGSPSPSRSSSAGGDRERTAAKPPEKKKPPSFFENTSKPIWEMDIEGEFARQERRKQEEEARNRKEAASGLGFGNLAMLDDPSVDLSARLRPKKLSGVDETDDDDRESQNLIGDGSGSKTGSDTKASLKPNTRASVSLDAIDLGDDEETEEQIRPRRMELRAY
jgi:ATP synthase protein I